MSCQFMYIYISRQFFHVFVTSLIFFFLLHHIDSVAEAPFIYVKLRLNTTNTVDLHNNKKSQNEMRYDVSVYAQHIAHLTDGKYTVS